jgi:PST family polysaccharide transporter
MNKEIREVKSKSFISTVSLLGQSGYAAILGFTAQFIFTVKLGVNIFGIYSLVLATMSFFNYITELGLAAAIMQKKDIKDEDLSTAFFLQLTMTSAAVVFGFFITNFVFTHNKTLPPNAVPLYWTILLSFFFLSLKSIPSVLLEKRLEIYKVVFVQAVENTVFYVSIILLVLMGFELKSLIIAVLLRSIIGLCLIYFFNPWIPRRIFSFKSAKSLLSFGLPYQGNSFLALIKDDLLTIYLGFAIGATNLGYVSFGKKYAEFSIRLVMDNINRVAFPLFSRFQNDTELLKKSLRKILFYESFFIFPIIIGALFIFDSLLRVIPIPGYFEKWHLSLFSFYLFSASAFFVSLSSPFINLFNAIGKIKLSLFFMILWTTIIWIMVPLLTKILGFNGVSIAFFIMSLTFIFVYKKAKQFVSFSLLDFIKDNLLASLAMAIFLQIVRFYTLFYLSNPYLHLLLSIIGGTAVYFGVHYILKGNALKDEFFELFKLKNDQT